MKACESGKLVYRTELAAKVAAWRYACNPKLGRSRVYRCNKCHRWHLTTQLRDRPVEDLFRK